MSLRNSVPRKPHYWRMRKDGYRELLSSKRWTFCGGYSSKTIRGETVMMRTHETEQDHYVLIVERKKDHWHRIKSGYRYRQNRWERARSRRVWHAFNWRGQHTIAPTKRDLVKNLLKYLSDEAGFLIEDVIEEKDCAGQYRLTILGEPWFIFRRQRDAERAGFTTANYRGFDFLYTDPYGPKSRPRWPDGNGPPIPLWFQGEIGRRRRKMRLGIPQYVYMEEPWFVGEPDDWDEGA